MGKTNIRLSHSENKSKAMQQWASKNGREGTY